MLTTLSLLLPAALAATPIHPGELAGSLSNGGYTLPDGEARIQVVAPSSFAVSDRLELQSSLLGLLGGPNLAAELGLLSDEGQALSITPAGSLSWDGSTLSTGLRAAYTLGGIAQPRLNLGLGAGWTRSAGASGLTTNISVGYELPLKEHSLLQFSGAVDPLSSIKTSSFSGTAGAGYIHGWERYRIEALLLLAQGSIVTDALDDAGIQQEIPALLPVPFVLMWWRI